MKISPSIEQRINMQERQQKVVDTIRLILILQSAQVIPINLVYEKFYNLQKKHKSEFSDLDFSLNPVYSEKLEDIFFQFGVWGRLQFGNPPEFDSYVIKRDDKKALMRLYKAHHGSSELQKLKQYAEEFSL